MDVQGRSTAQLLPRCNVGPIADVRGRSVAQLPASGLLMGGGPHALQASAAPSNTFSLLEYKYVPDILEKRGPYRAAHIAGAQKKVRSWQPGASRGRPSLSRAAAGHALLQRPLLPTPQAEEGKIILAGAAGDPVEGALFVFKNTPKEVRCCSSTALHLLLCQPGWLPPPCNGVLAAAA